MLYSCQSCVRGKERQQGFFNKLGCRPSRLSKERGPDSLLCGGLLGTGEEKKSVFMVPTFS